MKIKFIVPILLLALMGCTAKTAKKADKPLKVSAITAIINQSATNTPYIGVVESHSDAKLSFSVSGTISRICVKEGDRVKQGQLLAQLTAPNIEQSLSAAEATYAQANDGFKRAQMLYDSRSIPEIDFIKAQSAQQQAQSALAIAQKNVEYTQLRAPHSGYIGRVVGSAGEVALPSEVVLTLVELNRVNIKVSVPEGEISDIEVGDDATISVVALADESLSGKVTSKGINTNPLSHTYEVMVSVDNREGKLLAGMISRVSIAKEGAQSIIIPNRAVALGTSGGHYVWVIEGGKAQRREVKLGELAPEGVAVMSGINAGDSVITAGYQRVSNGDKVEVIQ